MTAEPTAGVMEKAAATNAAAIITMNTIRGARRTTMLSQVGFTCYFASWRNLHALTLTLTIFRAIFLFVSRALEIRREGSFIHFFCSHIWSKWTDKLL